MASTSHLFSNSLSSMMEMVVLVSSEVPLEGVDLDEVDMLFPVVSSPSH